MTARKDASGYNVKALWVPTIRPGDTVDIDLRYFRQTFGGAQVAFGNLFNVLKVEFEFDTIEPINNMRLVLLAEDSQ